MNFRRQSFTCVNISKTKSFFFLIYSHFWSSAVLVACLYYSTTHQQVFENFIYYYLFDRSVVCLISNRSDRNYFKMALLAYFIVALIVIISWYHKKYNHRNKLLAKIPTIKSYPLIGSNLSFVGKSAAGIFDTLKKAADELGTVWRFDISPFQSNIVVHDPKITEGILSSQKLLDKSIEYKFVQQWLNDGGAK